MTRRMIGAITGMALLVAGCSDSGSGGGSINSSGLPLPSTVSRRAYQEKLYAFLGERRYVDLGWRHDKGIRDTGPYLNGFYYGTHPAVRVYYSPEVIEWLEHDRQGTLPDGAIIIKEMFAPPAARYAGMDDAPLPVPTQWTVMTRDSAGPIDGWFWTYFSSNPRNTNPPIAQEPDSVEFPFGYPDSDFGSYCVRCHASAASEMTFSTTENIEGFPGEPIAYEVDDSWRNDPDGPYGPDEDPHPNEDPATPTLPAHDFVNQDWLALYDQFPLADAAAIEPIPPVSTDRVSADGQTQFVTSDQCESCHSGDDTPFGPNLVVQGVDVSPYAEWRWTMMGLSGRDPIFHAQLETETTLHGKPDSDIPAAQIENLCLSCHGVMGQRQFRLDHPDEPFTIEAALAHEEDDPLRSYGGLARDGVSCAACHRIKDDSDLPLADIQNGRFLVDQPTDGVLPIYGPFDDPSEHSMLGALAMRPVESAHMDSSRVCASCHTVFLPVLDAQGRVVDQKFEQATFLEWVNSDYRDGGSQAQSCQFCHMPDVFAGEALNVKIANIQDQDFPITSFLAPEEDITVMPRSGYRRHMLQSINLYALEMFRQFPDILGVRPRSFMTGFENGLLQAINNAFDGALHRSASVQILDTERNGDAITASIKVTNLVGHRLPSGVGFRRLILEFDVIDADEHVVWSSGRTNSLGVIVDEHGEPLPSEFHAVDPMTGEQAYQPHYQVVDSQSRAQIYEELLRDSTGAFTTSFLARVEDVKDNRLLPAGWTEHGPAGFAPEHAEATHPHGDAADDADFTDGTGSDTITYVAHIPGAAAMSLQVRASLYSQSIPPRYLNDRFNQANGPATRRLHYLGSHLDDGKTYFPGWKLPLGSASAELPPA